MDRKVIGEGSYGCVHKPSLECEKKPKNLKTYDGKVSKILDKSEANSEMKEFKVIKEFDSESNFHSGTPTKCPPLDNDIQRSHIKKCKNTTIKNATKSTNPIKDTLGLLVMEDGGVDMRDFVNKLSKKTITPSNTKMVELFLIEFERVFLGIKYFEENGIIHNDLKVDNIVYNQQKNRINFIDFGLTSKYSSINYKINKNNFFLSNGCHWNFPPDITLLDSYKFTSLQYYLKNNKKTFQKLLSEHFFENQYGMYSTEWISIFMEQTYPGINNKTNKEILDRRNKDLINSVKTYKNIKPQEFYDISIYTIDSYGIGITLSYCIHKLKKFLDNNIFSQLLGLCETMTNWNIHNRKDCDELLTSFQNILSNNNILNKHNLKIESGKIVKDNISNKTKKSIVISLPTTKKPIMMLPPDPPKEEDFPPPPEVIQPKKAKKTSNKRKTSKKKSNSPNNKTRKDNYSIKKGIFKAQQIKNRFHRLKGRPDLADINYKHTGKKFPRLSKIIEEIRRIEREENKSPLLNPTPIKK